jgi:uncharacterized protein (TIGR04255 family)
VSKRGSRIPTKLKTDAIVEATFEVRFNTSTSPEFLIVRIAEFGPWKSYSQARLPAYSIPENVRQADPNFRYQSTFELIEASNHRTVRIGPNVLSYHVRRPYVGWVEFKREIERAIGRLFEISESLVATRLGLRYVNALSFKDHGVRSIEDLDLSVQIAGNPLTSRVNLNFSTSISESTEAVVRIASTEFIGLPQFQEATVLADIDIFTKQNFEATSQTSISKWLEDAHIAEKEEFFRLLPDTTIARLEELR